MLCDKCKQNVATTHVKHTINGQTTQMHLCSECAAQEGLSTTIGLDFGDFWGSLFAEPTKRMREDTVRCPDCGYSFRQIAEMGKPACPACYVTFYDRLIPSIQRIHGKTQHTGKVAEKADDGIKRERELSSLRDELARCVEQQEFEKCAELRDRIRQLEEEGDK